MFIIAGLGNPGLSYRRTRHNVGFMTLDVLSKRLGISVTETRFSALCGEGMYKGEKLLLMKPQTYMNLSGDAVGAAMRYYKLPPEKLIMIYDDVDLPVGYLRVRASGSAGSHNGMKSITACMGSGDFPRVRVGIGQDKGLLLADYVLKRPSKDEFEQLELCFEQAADAALDVVEGHMDEAQAKFNHKKPPAEQKPQVQGESPNTKP